MNSWFLLFYVDMRPAISLIKTEIVLTIGIFCRLFFEYFPILNK